MVSSFFFIEICRAEPYLREGGAKKMKWEGSRQNIRDILKILLGTVFMALAVNLVFEPLGIVPGGVSGLSIVVKRAAMLWFGIEIPVWISNFVLNIPVFSLAYCVLGKRYLGKTMLANLMFTLALFLVPEFSGKEEDFFLAAVIGGMLNGVGLGMVFSTGASTGGTDLLSAVVQHFKPGHSVSAILMVIDVLVIGAGAWFFGVSTAVYAGISVYLASRIMDSIIEGVKFGKLAYVISDKYQVIGEAVMNQMGRGVTLLDARGMYTGRSRCVLLCVVRKKEIPALKQIACSIDDHAFIIISDAREILGEGFILSDKTSSAPADTKQKRSR